MCILLQRYYDRHQASLLAFLKADISEDEARYRIVAVCNLRLGMNYFSAMAAGASLLPVTMHWDEYKE